MSFDNIRLEKGMYGAGRSFTKSLEELDPSINYKGTELEGLDAYQRQLKRFGIKPSGSDSSVVGKFFQTSDAAVLFPEFVSRAVRYGMDEASFLPDVVATTTNIDSMDYRVMELNMSSANAEMKPVTEGSVLTESQFTISDRNIRLKKRGRLLSTSYDVIRFQRLDIIAIALKRIGAYLAQSLMADAVEVLVNGDNGKVGNKADQYTLTGSHFTYNDMVDFWNDFSPYEMNTVLASPEAAAEILKLAEFRDAAAGLSFHGTGKMITPFGAKFIKTSHVTNGMIIGLDNTCSLEMLKVGDIETDYGKLVDRQLEQIAITAITGFARILPNSVKILSASSINSGSVDGTEIKSDDEK